MSKLSGFTEIIQDDSPSLDSLFASMESCLNVTLTLHDARGLFREVDISNRWFNHQHPICRHKRKGAADRQCLKTCQSDVHSRARDSERPFEKLCWKGLIEVVSPYYRDGQLQFVIFAGPFKSSSASTAISPDIRKLYSSLECPDESRLQHLARILQVLGHSVFEYLEKHAVSPSESTERMGIIRKFIYQHASEKVSLKDLAEHLYLSPSRASHLVSNLFGKSFSELLKEERIKRACSILRNSRKPIKTVPEMIGLESEFHFYRLFKKEVGMTPKKYRQVQQN